MGYPMMWSRLVGRNRGIDALDIERLERDQRDEDHLNRYAELAGITPDQVKKVLDLFFESGFGKGLYALKLPECTPLGPHDTGL